MEDFKLAQRANRALSKLTSVEALLKSLRGSLEMQIDACKDATSPVALQLHDVIDYAGKFNRAAEALAQIAETLETGA